MDADRFDALTRTLTSGERSRRRLLAGLAGSAAAAVAVALGFAEAGALHYDCRHVGKPCTRNSQCCSSRCLGRRDRKKCQAHHAGTCRVEQNYCTNSLARCGGGSCVCYRTTGGANFCASTREMECDAVCSTDAQCANLLGTPGAACVVRGGINCSTEYCYGHISVCAYPCTP